VEAKRDNWHKFWYAAHHLTPEIFPERGGGGKVAVGEVGGAACGGPSQDQKEEWKTWLGDRSHVFMSNRHDFDKAGLLGAAGDEYGIGAQFAQAEELLIFYFGRDFTKRAGSKSVKRKKDCETDSQSSTVPASPLQDAISVDEDQHQQLVHVEKRVKIELAPHPSTRVPSAAGVY